MSTSGRTIIRPYSPGEAVCQQRTALQNTILFSFASPCRRERFINPVQEVILKMQNKKNPLNFELFFILSLLIVLLPFNASAAPREVTLFPDSARIVEVTKVKLQAEGKDPGKDLGKGVFFLPAQADPETLTTHLPDGSKMKIEDQTWRQVVRQDDVKISEHKKQIEKIKNDRRSLQASIYALSAQIQFWQLQTKAKTKTLTDAYNMAAAIGKNSKKAYHDKLNQELELEILDRQIRNLQDELERTADKKETFWEVTVILSGPQMTESTLTYSYSMSRCGWLPLYRFEARPKDGRVFFTWEAEIWQNAGQDWNQVIIHLATLKPPLSVSPPDLPTWVIKPQALLKNKDGKVTEIKKGMKRKDKSFEKITEPTGAPPQTGQNTYAFWKLGIKNIPAGSRQKVKLQEETWPSEFSYLIRPGLSPQAFVRASSRLPEPKEIPLGAATFMVDGAILGKRQFSNVGQDAVLFFGFDPMVTAEKTLLSKKTGAKDVLTGNQTHFREWRIDVKNSREDSVKITIEEPNPQLGDERIKLTLKYDPEPSEKTLSQLIWNFSMAAGQKKSVFSSLSLEAPDDMKLDSGWQR